MNLHRPQHTEDLDPHVEQLLARLQASFAEYEHQQRVQALMRAKRVRAAMGRAVSRPPAGYIVTAKGRWGKDPAASERIADVFRLYQALGSVGKVAEALATQQLKMPFRTPTGELRWMCPTRFRIYSILTNPSFMGWYVFGRYTRVQSAPYGKRRKTAWEERVIVPDHHEPYVTPEIWHRINQRLRSRAVRVRQQTPLGPPCSGDGEGDDRAVPPAGEGRAVGAEDCLLRRQVPPQPKHGEDR